VSAKHTLPQTGLQQNGMSPRLDRPTDGELVNGLQDMGYPAQWWLDENEPG
jgi:hypothetical protein